MKESTEDKRPSLFLYTPNAEFVRPYFDRLMSEYRITDSAENASAAVMISSTDIYDADNGSNFNELTPLKQNSPTADAENHFITVCRDNGLTPTILRCAPIVGTGMTGMPRQLAGQIYRGTFIALQGNEARMSLVHAVSLPDAARIAIGRDDIFNVTDSTDPTLNDFADALAWRISQKRIFSLPLKWYRLFFGRKKTESVCRSLTFSCEKLRSAGEFKPVAVVEYLKTHVYNDASL